MIWYPVKKETFYQFHGGYMTHHSLKKYRTYIKQVIKKILEFKFVTLKCILNELLKKCVYSFINDA